MFNEDYHIIMYKLLNKFYSTDLFTKFLNKTGQFLITHDIKWNQEFFYVI